MRKVLVYHRSPIGEAGTQQRHSRMTAEAEIPSTADTDNIVQVQHFFAAPIPHSHVSVDKQEEDIRPCKSQHLVGIDEA